MFKKKNFIINCDICDARKIKEDDWDSYESIIINADLLVVDERSKSILNNLPLVTNVDETLETSDEINLTSQNGDYEITEQASFSANTVLVVNGSLRIHPKTEEGIKNLYRIFVNGCLIYPKSLSGCMDKISVNGSVKCYPDDCIIMPPSFTIDKYFPLRAKAGSKYYCEDEVLLIDDDINPDSLINKQIRFFTDKFIVAEKYLEVSLPMFEEKVELQVIPSGYSFVNEDAVLDKNLITQYGKKLYINGDLTLNEESQAFLSELEGLSVSGTVTLYEEQLEEFGKLHARYRDLNIMKNMKARLFLNNPIATLDSSILKNSPDGVIYKNCGVLHIRKDVTVDQILEMVQTENCGCIFCSPEQKSAVEAVSKNAGYIYEGEDEGKSFKDMVGDVLHSRIINADYHVL